MQLLSALRENSLRLDTLAECEARKTFSALNKTFRTCTQALQAHQAHILAVTKSKASEQLHRLTDQYTAKSQLSDFFKKAYSGSRASWQRSGALKPQAATVQGQPSEGPKAPLLPVLQNLLEETYRLLPFADSGSTMEQATGPPQSSEERASKRHIIVLVNGLWGSKENWTVVMENLEEKLGLGEIVLLPSNSNQRLQTYEGIDKCGERLAAEVRETVAQYPNLQRISFLGHSMGGLIARHAIGQLYEPRSRRMAGLQPAHFISMAAPHLGCSDLEGPAQVPFLSWLTQAPVVGGGLQRVVAASTKPVSSALLGITGQQFFLHDGTPDREPLLVRMTRDVEGEGHFYSGLASFVTRTAYANSSGDHLVGWANSSLRRPAQLPLLTQQGRGVVREDPLEAAFHPDALHSVSAAADGSRHGTAATERLTSLQNGGGGSGAVAARADSSGAAASSGGTFYGSAISSQSWAQGPSGCVGDGGREELASTADSRGGHAASNAAGAEPHARLEEAGAAVRAASEAVEQSPETAAMLAALQRLPWRRIDVCFRALRSFFMAHNHIQVTRRWMNWEGEAVAQHLAQQVALMEKDPRVLALCGDTEREQPQQQQQQHSLQQQAA